VALPTQAQVNAYTRHAASFAAGMIAMFGLSTKVDPQTVVAIINSLGTLTNDAVTFIGLATPLVVGWYAQRSASPDAQKKSVAAQPNTMVVQTSSAAATVKTANAIAAIPEVNQVTSSANVAAATPSNKVVS